MIESIDAVSVARGYLGTPWRHGGADRNGMDCAGLVLAVAADLGFPIPASMAYSPLPDLDLFSLLPQFCVRLGKPEVGGIVRLTVAGRPQHMAIVADHRDGGVSLIHAYMPLARVVEHRLDYRWERRIVSAWRIGTD
jgi:cell wall-associated NlpC family hydrolase